MSTKDVLSEGEIDALMESVSSGDVPLETSSDQTCQPFDFSTREQAMVAQMPALRDIVEKQAQLLAEVIGELFKIKAAVEIAEIRVVKLEEAIMAIPEWAAANQLKISPLNGSSLLVMKGELLSFFVDQFFGGGRNKGAFKPSRAVLSPTEKRINELVSRRFLNTLEESWKEKITLNAEFIPYEEKSGVAQIAVHYEPVLQFSFAVSCGEWSSTIEWVIPYAALEPYKDRLTSNEAVPVTTPSGDWAAAIRQSLLDIDVELNALFTSRQMSLAEVLDLKIGSIVPIKMPSEALLQLDGELFGTGEHGESNKKKSIKIQQRYR